ncbi:MAG: hypothetical protein ABIV50_15690 [Opitutus sp.]
MTSVTLSSPSSGIVISFSFAAVLFGSEWLNGRRKLHQTPSIMCFEHH